MELGRILIVIGVLLVITGLLISSHTVPLGRLPGDIIIERERSTVYIPVTTMVLLSIIATAALWIISSK